jgi:hypothetical protein
MPWRARVAESRLPAAGREMVAAPIRASLSRAMHRGSVTSAANTARPAVRSSSRPHKPRRATPGWPWRGPILLGHRCDRPVAGRRGRSPVDSPGAARYPAEPPTWTEPSGGRCRSYRSSCPPDPPAASFGLTPRDVARASRRLETPSAIGLQCLLTSLAVDHRCSSDWCFCWRYRSRRFARLFSTCFR